MRGCHICVHVTVYLPWDSSRSFQVTNNYTSDSHIRQFIHPTTYFIFKYFSSFIGAALVLLSMGIVGLRKAIMELPPDHPTRIKLLFLLR